ncbi:maltodextrin glucosidase [Deinococcus cellulosilyticus NBRC 106333 = KACC 11606]|uniref:Maltodextrin glucosidase n=2 Tax=Deinococcus cellulosilyticus TaxID=401558 RepID=A0A511MYE5_DEIC1|nr:maltodextrin glucosidase [Deinococcus cellulosilyticus NBRC 106333 = KACC 11606]
MHFLEVHPEHLNIKVEAPPETTHGWVVTYLGGDEQQTPLHKEGPCWTGRLPRSNLHYRFRFLVQGKVWWYNQSGVSSTSPAFHTDFKHTEQAPPEWVHGRVFYQIFVDRFKNGNPALSVREGEYLYEGHPVKARRWEDSPTREHGAREFYGGDLEGIRQSVPYLKTLGVNALYLNPIFESPSSHKYDTQDYHRIDPHFGTNQDFARWMKDMHENDIRVVLDGVFNHTGDRHMWMNREQVYGFRGAHQGGDTRRHYTYHGPGPDDYLGWAGIKTLPKLDYQHPEVRSKMYGQRHSVVRYWLNPPYNVDGWRLDVSPMIGKNGTDEGNQEILSGIWQAARETRPDSFIFGEHVFDATRWLQGGVEDGSMNYHGFTHPTWGFLAGVEHRMQPAQVTAEDYAQRLTTSLSSLPHPHQLAQVNLLSSHDTVRFATLCPDPDLQKIGAALLLTFIGVPCIYYGDEIGLQGGEDPDCRKPMPWGSPAFQGDLHRWYRTLIQLRHQEQALQRGAFQVLHAQGDELVFERRLGPERIRVLLSRGEGFLSPLEGQWLDPVTSQLHRKQVRIPSKGVVILKSTCK